MFNIRKLATRTVAGRSPGTCSYALYPYIPSHWVCYIELSILFWFWQIMGLVASLYNHQIGCICCTFYVPGTILAWYATNPAYPPGSRYLILKAHWIETLVTLPHLGPSGFPSMEHYWQVVVFFNSFWEPGQEKTATARHGLGQKVKWRGRIWEKFRRFWLTKNDSMISGTTDATYSSLGGSSQWMQAVRNPTHTHTSHVVHLEGSHNASYHHLRPSWDDPQSEFFAAYGSPPTESIGI